MNARLLVRTLRKVTLVPTAAVQHNGTAAFVYVVQQNSTVSVQSVTALTNNDQVTAVQGLNSGVNVATKWIRSCSRTALQQSRTTIRRPVSRRKLEFRAMNPLSPALFFVR